MLCRPIFLLDDNFIRDHKVKYQRSYVTPILAPSEDINFSNLAIKFSKRQTKESIFTSVRDIIRKIADSIDRNIELKIDFSFGTLHIKERRLKFEFNQERLMSVSIPARNRSDCG